MFRRRTDSRLERRQSPDISPPQRGRRLLPPSGPPLANEGGARASERRRRKANRVSVGVGGSRGARREERRCAGARMAQLPTQAGSGERFNIWLVTKEEIP